MFSEVANVEVYECWNIRLVKTTMVNGVIRYELFSGIQGLLLEPGDLEDLRVFLDALKEDGEI